MEYWVLAHGSGIDDVLVFVIPASITLVLLRWSLRSARARAEHSKDPDNAEDLEKADVD